MGVKWAYDGRATGMGVLWASDGREMGVEKNCDLMQTRMWDGDLGSQRIRGSGWESDAQEGFITPLGSLSLSLSFEFEFEFEFSGGPPTSSG
jgi:hypothetical protein